MKHTRLFALLLALALCAALLAGCSGSSEDEDEADEIHATAGGSVTLPEGFSASGSFTSQVSGDALYATFSFSGAQKKETGYFSPAGTSITVTAFATTENQHNKEFKFALWQKVDGGMSYVSGTTVYYTADGSCYTYTYEGLDPNSQYRLAISHDSPSYVVSGQFAVTGLATATQSDEELDEENA